MYNTEKCLNVACLDELSGDFLACIVTQKSTTRIFEMKYGGAKLKTCRYKYKSYFDIADIH